MFSGQRKHIYLLFTIAFYVFSTVNTYCQTQEWSLPFSLTDSLTDNHNPRIAVYDAGIDLLGIVFWERNINDSTTAIWMRHLSDMTQEEQVFYQEGVHFRNLHFFSTYGTDTLIYIFYEANLTGNFDIYMSKYSEDGNITDPEFIIGGDGDEINMDALPSAHIAWQIDGKIKVSQYMGGSNFAEPVTIDSINCLNPSLGSSGIVYEKIINDSSRIFYATLHYIYGWSEPDILFDHGHNSSLGYAGPKNQPNSFGYTILWETHEGSDWTILMADLDGPEICNTMIVSDNQLYPKGLIIWIPVLNDGIEEPTILTYSKNVDGFREIYANAPSGGFQNCYNISNSQTLDTKPNIEIGGYHYGTYYIYDVWERYINGHWQLMASRLNMQVDIDENIISDTECNIILYPNPFTDHLTIEFSDLVKGRVQVNVYNSSGTLIHSFQDFNIKQIHWDRNSQHGRGVPPGIYLIEILTESQKFFEKVIVADKIR